ncbi:hypothetical protein TRIUR3_23024 [Triticum urartu]|uniref:Centromere protein X n=1 Tax=Triticum urartu TaxID=4572 RepID=M7ZVG8_TRIUA|nr:hypothetical protein TRIUR3_23024 [Triticum urartu]
MEDFHEETREARDETFNPLSGPEQDLIRAIFKLVWSRRTDRGGVVDEAVDVEPAAETSRRNRSTSANASALQVSCELLRMFVAEAVQRCAVIAEAEGTTTIEPTHLERVLPQLLLDF